MRCNLVLTYGYCTRFKKSTQGIKTPEREIDLIRERIKRLKEMLR